MWTGKLQIGKLIFLMNSHCVITIMIITESFNSLVCNVYRICNFNRHYAEQSGYWKRSSTFFQELPDKVREGKETITFYDSNTGKPLFIAPKGRTFQNFVDESTSHGWPSFRDTEVVWENVRCLPNGETVSVDGTHLGHNLPDRKGSRYCINLVSVAGSPNGIADEFR